MAFLVIPLEGNFGDISLALLPRDHGYRGCLEKELLLKVGVAYFYPKLILGMD